MSPAGNLILNADLAVSSSKENKEARLHSHQQDAFSSSMQIDSVCCSWFAYPETYVYVHVCTDTHIQSLPGFKSVTLSQK